MLNLLNTNITPALTVVAEVLPRNITRVASPICLPYGWYEMHLVPDMEQAVEVADGRTSYLYKSKVIEGYYLFIPVEES